MRSFVPLLFATGALAGAVKNQFTATGTAQVAAAAATAKTESSTSKVRGKAFNRFATIWLENTDYEMAINDPNLAYLASKGITLTNYYGVTHPSEPNYAAAIGGDYFGLQNDDFHQIARNISTIIDLLEDRGVSWAHYQEGMPYSGYEGFEWINHTTGQNNYVRKHNPGILYNSVAGDANRLPFIKNMTMFYEDLENEALPQWMFITPNMLNDGHDTSVTQAGSFTRGFLEPLLTDRRFMENTLVLITFDENETYTKQNRVLAILIGDAVPLHKIGTNDNNYYNHYSSIASVEANFNLHTLGRWDVGANVFEIVADRTGDVVRPWDGAVPFCEMHFNESYAGPFNSDGGNAIYAAPNVTKNTFSGRTVLPAIRDAWKDKENPVYYTDTIAIPDGQHPPAGFAPVA